jgi:hypothetical protein
MERVKISARLRFEILERDAFTCRYCGARGTTAQLVVDHVIPVIQGGATTPENLVTACLPCNQGKGSLVLDPSHRPDGRRLYTRRELDDAVAEFWPSWYGLFVDHGCPPDDAAVRSAHLDLTDAEFESIWADLATTVANATENVAREFEAAVAARTARSPQRSDGGAAPCGRA